MAPVTQAHQTMSVKAAATALHIKPNSVRGMVRLGLLRAVDAEPHLIVFASDVERVAAEMEAKRVAPPVDGPTVELDFA